MALAQLRLDSLAGLDDGRPSKAWLHELAHVVQDCIDRPGDDTAREVSLTLKLKPIPSNENGVVIAETCEGEFYVKSKVPVRKTKTYSFRANKKGHLLYSADSPDNVDQQTLLP